MTRSNKNKKPSMNFENIKEFIKDLGFPIFVAIYFMFVLPQSLDDIQGTLNDLTIEQRVTNKILESRRDLIKEFLETDSRYNPDGDKEYNEDDLYRDEVRKKKKSKLRKKYESED